MIVTVSMLGDLAAGAQLLADPFNILLIVLGVFIGITMGSIPGMTATMTVAVTIPFTFGMEPLPALMLLLGIYGAANYAGGIPAILIRTPGTGASAATVLDGFPMSENGEAGRAIIIATLASFIGGITSILIITFVAPQVASVALIFESPEYFALAVFGLAVIASVSADEIAKGIISGLLGMFLATVGQDLILGHPRFTFGVDNLVAGVEFISVLIGLFGISQGLKYYKQGIGSAKVDQKLDSVRPSLQDLWELKGTLVGSSLLGTFIGALPGAGGTVASFITYNEAKRWKDKPDPHPFGEGNPHGVAAAEAGNNASTGGALIPTLTLGIPGDAVSAILIGLLLVHGLNPGPGLFEEDAPLMFAIFIGFGVAYFGVLIMGLVGAKYWARVISFPPKYLWPIIFLLCLVGTISLRGNIFDAWIMLAAGFLGFVMRADNYPLAPMVLGIVLAPIVEENLRRTLILSGGSLEPFYTRPITAIVLVLSIITLLAPVIANYRGN